MNCLFLFLLAMGLSALPLMAMDHSEAATKEEQVTFMFNLFRSQQLKIEEMKAHYSLHGDACKQFVDTYWNDIISSARKLLQNNNNLKFGDLENGYAALWLAESVASDAKESARAKEAHDLMDQIITYNRLFMVQNFISQALGSSERTIIEQAVTALDLFEHHFDKDAEAMRYIREKRPLLQEKLRLCGPEKKDGGNPLLAKNRSVESDKQQSSKQKSLLTSLKSFLSGKRIVMIGGSLVLIVGLGLVAHAKYGKNNKAGKNLSHSRRLEPKNKMEKL